MSERYHRLSEWWRFNGSKAILITLICAVMIAGIVFALELINTPRQAPVDEEPFLRQDLIGLPEESLYYDEER